jgi:amidase
VTEDFGNLTWTAPGVPFGISFMGGHFSEELLIGLAYAFEQRTRIRSTIPPYIQPTTEMVDILSARLRSTETTM